MALDTALLAAVRQIMDDPEYDVTWQDRRTGWRSASGHVSILPLSTTPVGKDEIRQGAASGGSYTERVYGNRTVRVQFSCETDDQDPGADASELAERLAAGFEGTPVEEILDAHDLGGVRVQPRRVLNYPDAHGDTRSRVVFEVWLLTHRSQITGTVDHVAAVEFSGEVTDEAGDVAATVGPVTVEIE